MAPVFIMFKNECYQLSSISLALVFRDCAVCIPECPTNAIMAEEDVPEDQQEFIALNAELARVWPSITRMKPHTDEAEKWRDVLDKRQYLKKEL